MIVVENGYEKMQVNGSVMQKDSGNNIGRQEGKGGNGLEREPRVKVLTLEGE